MTLDSPVADSTRLHLCRFGTDEVLLPENGVRFDDPSDPRPSGAVYKRISVMRFQDLPPDKQPYGPGPEDEDRCWEGGERR
jgi:hypothetical protein